EEVLGDHLGVAGRARRGHGCADDLLGLEGPLARVDGHGVVWVSYGRPYGAGNWLSGTRSRRYRLWVASTASRASRRAWARAWRRRSFSSSNAITWRTPSRLSPALVSSWMRRSLSMSM